MSVQPSSAHSQLCFSMTMFLTPVAVSLQSCHIFLPLCHEEDLSLLKPFLMGSRSLALQPEAHSIFFFFFFNSNFAPFSCTLHMQDLSRSSLLLHLLLFQLHPATNLPSVCRADTPAFVLKGNISISSQFFSDSSNLATSAEHFPEPWGISADVGCKEAQASLGSLLQLHYCCTSTPCA